MTGGPTESSNDQPTTPVSLTQTKSIEATVAESSTMNYLLQRLEMGASLDLSTQLAILENDSILFGLQDDTFGSSGPKANEVQ